jgi:hypothetical protein
MTPRQRSCFPASSPIPSGATQRELALTQILSGQFDDFERAKLLIDKLLTLGIARDDVQQFALNAPGQHDRFPLGGDEDADAGAQGGGNTAVAGAALGGAAGAALGAAGMAMMGPVAAVAGLAIGAYTGSFAGALNGLGDKADGQEPRSVARPAGVRVAVHVPTAEQRAVVCDALLRHHARSIEEAEGIWRDGIWADFDPISVPHWVIAPSS